MITEMEELQEVKLLFNEVKDDLRSKKIAFDPNVPLGAMIEVPAAAAITDLLVKEVDFLSIGTNDLIQYYLAVDRSNEFVSYLYKPFHPAILRVIQFVIEIAQKEGKEVTVCGEDGRRSAVSHCSPWIWTEEVQHESYIIPRIKNSLRSVEYRNVQKIIQNVMTLKNRSRS